MTYSRVRRALHELRGETPCVSLKKRDRYVIVSDLHLGDGGERDKFVRNETLFEAALRRHYLEGRYKLVLNGDIEELYHYPLSAIQARWRALYSLFDSFDRRTELWRILGNHDLELPERRRFANSRPASLGLRLTGEGNELFIFHGHQASLFFDGAHSVVRFLIRNMTARAPLRKGSIRCDRRRKTITERRIHNFAREAGLLALIGHTHRPRFDAGGRTRGKDETSLFRNRRASAPCLFNSGSAINRRGITALEIADGRIALAWWYDRSRMPRKTPVLPWLAEPLPGTPFERVILNQAPLSSLFRRLAECA